MLEPVKTKFTKDISEKVLYFRLQFSILVRGSLKRPAGNNAPQSIPVRQQLSSSIDLTSESLLSSLSMVHFTNRHSEKVQWEILQFCMEQFTN